MELAHVTIDDIKKMDQAGLDKIYGEAEAGPIPDGDSNGIKIVFPESPAYESSKQQEEMGIIWEGKLFSCPNPEGPGMLKNKVNGQLVFEAEAYYGTSDFDGGKCIILDYSKAPEYPTMRVRDEIRRVTDGLYLGRMNRVDEQGNIGEFLLNFVLDFN